MAPKLPKLPRNQLVNSRECAKSAVLTPKNTSKSVGFDIKRPYQYADLMFDIRKMRVTLHDSVVVCHLCGNYIAPDTGYYTQFMTPTEGKLVWLCRRDLTKYMETALDAIGAVPLDYGERLEPVMEKHHKILYTREDRRASRGRRY